MAKRIGQRVKILGGLREFVGQVGEIVDVEKWGRETYYRVRLDGPVFVPGVGSVRDDLWMGDMLQSLPNERQLARRRAAAKARRAALRDVLDSVGMTEVRGNLGGRYYE